VGFKEMMHHQATIVWLRRVDGLLVNGNQALMRRQYERAAEHYDQAFGLREGAGEPSYLMADPIDQRVYLYNAACAQALAGHPASAQRLLDKALDMGTFRQGGY
jgi:hypothetical protein